MTPASAISPLAAYARFLPTFQSGSILTVGEGWTPLIRSQSLGPRLGIDNLWFKLEQTNPSGSYKDRFTVGEVSLMRGRGQSMCIATSSGNTGSSLAAVCARAGFRCVIFLTEQTPSGKLTQMRAHGAVLFRVRGFGTSAQGSAAVFDGLADLSSKLDIPLIISAYKYCPVGMEGVKTIAFEIVDQLGAIPSDVFVPIGAGGLYSAVARGFLDVVAERGRDVVSPRIHGVQPVGNDTVVSAWAEGSDQPRSIESTTAISGLAVPTDIDGSRALKLLRATRGTGVLVDDEFVWEVQQDLARNEGIYVEPAGAVSVAGFVRAVRDRGFRPDDSVVCVLTGHGFKDPMAAERMAGSSPVDLIDDAEIEAPISQMAGRSENKATWQ